LSQLADAVEGLSEFPRDTAGCHESFAERGDQAAVGFGAADVRGGGDEGGLGCIEPLAASNLA
jgi:hypothetical protein